MRLAPERGVLLVREPLPESVPLDGARVLRRKLGAPRLLRRLRARNPLP